MNDRFKFRIFDLEQKHYLRVIQDETTGAEGFAAFYGKYNNICKPMSFFLCHDIDRWVVEQCAGLKDKNGNLIYEGDIIKDRGGITYKIQWKDACFFAVAIDNFNYMPDSMLVQTWLNTWKAEIISNVHEQAEQKDVK